MKNTVGRVLNRLGVFLLALVLTISSVPAFPLGVTVASAATSGEVAGFADANVELNFSGDGEDAWTASGTSITGKVACVKGTCSNTDYSSTLTITNKRSVAATLKFLYKVSLGGGSVTIDGTAISADASFEKELDPGASIQVKIASKGGTTSIALSDVALIAQATPQITFQKPENGSYTVDGKDVSENITVSKSSLEAYQLVAEPAAGYKFVGWYDIANQSYLSQSMQASLYFDTEHTLTAVFVEESTALFDVNGSVFSDLGEAVSYAQNQKASKITVASGGEIDGQYTIPAGITLLVPMDAAGTLYGAVPKAVHSGSVSTTKDCFRKLVLASGASLTVEGAISIGGTYYSAGGSDPGKMTGAYGQIQLDEGSSIDVRSGGSIYAWGYVSGAGSVNIQSGAKAYEWFQIHDFRGGSDTSTIASSNSKVFPFNQYFIQNIEASMTIFQGGSDIAYTSLYAMGSNNDASVNFIGDDGMFKVVSGSMTRRYDGAADRIIYTVDGESQLNNLKISAMGMNVDSKNYVLPIASNMTVNVNEASSLTVNQSAALLPGTQVNIARTGELDVANGVSLYVYDSSDWGAYSQNGRFGSVDFAPSKAYSRKDSDLVDATIDVNGTLAAQGSIYTTKGGAAIISSQGGGIYQQTGNPGTETSTSQYSGVGSSLKKNDIAITPARLLNSDGTYAPTESIAAGTKIVYKNGTWQEGKETYTVTWTDEDGTLLETDTVDAGDMPVYKGVTPTKAATAQYSYVFSGWTPEISSAAADVTYKATYTATTNEYTITWKNYDGTVLETSQEKYGTVPTYSGETPIKEGDAEHSYVFAGWKAIAADGTQSDIVAVAGDAVYTAVYAESVKSYTVMWINDDGKLLQKDEDVLYGTTPVYRGETPAKTATAQYTYTFAGWTPTVDKVTGDVTYTATYKSETNQYAITWRNADGTVLRTDKIDYGVTPSYSGETPTKTGDAEYSYIFKGWSPELVPVTGDAVYTAQFDMKKNIYTVTWKGADGVVLASSQAEYGTVPSYSGETPTKANDQYFSYIFTGWSPAISQDSTVTSDVTYTAQFARQSLYAYTVTFDANGGSGQMDSQTFSSGVEQNLRENAFTRDGYLFQGWNTKADGSGVTYADKGSLMPDTDMTLYAQWSFSSGWLTDANGKTYYQDGAVAYHGSWQVIDGATYYFKDDGYVATGIFSVAPQGTSTLSRCVFDAEGRFQSSLNGLHSTGSDIYWANSGVIEEFPGLKQVKSGNQILYYYFGEDGRAVRDGDYKVDKDNGLKLPSFKYHFLSDGTIEHDADTTKNGICSGDSSLYYYIDGIKVGMGLIKLDGSYYYVRTSSGEVVHGRSYWVTQTNGLGVAEGEYRFGDDGKMVLNGFVTDGAYTYHYVDGVQSKGFTKIDDAYYLFNSSSGMMYRSGTYWVPDNQYGIKGGMYRFNDDGKMVIEASFITKTLKDGTVATYYRSADGTYAKGLTKIGNDWYLFNRSSGAMYKDGTYWVCDNEGGSSFAGGMYRFGTDGKLQAV